MRSDIWSAHDENGEDTDVQVEFRKGGQTHTVWLSVEDDGPITLRLADKPMNPASAADYKTIFVHRA